MPEETNYKERGMSVLLKALHHNHVRCSDSDLEYYGRMEELAKQENVLSIHQMGNLQNLGNRYIIVTKNSISLEEAEELLLRAGVKYPILNKERYEPEGAIVFLQLPDKCYSRIEFIPQKVSDEIKRDAVVSLAHFPSFNYPYN